MAGPWIVCQYHCSSPASIEINEFSSYQQTDIPSTCYSCLTLLKAFINECSCNKLHDKNYIYEARQNKLSEEK